MSFSFSFIKNKIFTKYKYYDLFYTNSDWFTFFELNHFEEKFIIDDLNFSNVTLILDKLPNHLKIKLYSVVSDEKSSYNEKYFVIREIQSKYMFCSLTKNVHSKLIKKLNDSIKKNKCAFF
jgi:hypothetical protein